MYDQFGFWPSRCETYSWIHGGLFFGFFISILARPRIHPPLLILIPCFINFFLFAWNSNFNKILRERIRLSVMSLIWVNFRYQPSKSLSIWWVSFGWELYAEPFWCPAVVDCFEEYYSWKKYQAITCHCLSFERRHVNALFTILLLEITKLLFSSR